MLILEFRNSIVVFLFFYFYDTNSIVVLPHVKVGVFDVFVMYLIKI